MNSLFARHYFWLASMIFITVLVMGISFVTISSTYVSSELLKQLSRTAQRNAEAASVLLERDDSLDMRYLLVISVSSAVQGSHILVCDTEGTVVMCSDDMMCNEHIGKSIPPELTGATLTAGQAVTQGTLGGIYPTKYNVASHAIVSAESDQAVGLVLVSMESTENQLLLSSFFRIFFMVAIIVLVIASISTYWISKQLTKPLKAISDAARSYAGGDFAPRVSVHDRGNDEITVLCSNFNSMADSLEQLEGLRQEFIANVSHELRTPMTVIAGYVGGMLDGAIPPEDQERYLTIVQEEVHRLSRLVASMLDITQLQSGQINYTPRPVNLCEIVRRVILGFESRIESKSLEVACTLPPEDINVMFDPDAITQVLTNLTDNAIKFAPENGLLSLVVTHKGHRATVAVSNSGPEISKADLPFVFDRFHKADKSRAEDRVGLGLGLYIVKNILQNHHETIQVTSEKGLTTFTFSINLAKE